MSNKECKKGKRYDKKGFKTNQVLNIMVLMYWVPKSVNRVFKPALRYSKVCYIGIAYPRRILIDKRLNLSWDTL